MTRPPRDRDSAKQERRYEHQIPSRDEISRMMEQAGRPLTLEAIAPRFEIGTEQQNHTVIAGTPSTSSDPLLYALGQHPSDSCAAVKSTSPEALVVGCATWKGIHHQQPARVTWQVDAVVSIGEDSWPRRFARLESSYQRLDLF